MMLDEPRTRPTIVLVLPSTVIYFVYVLNNENIDSDILPNIIDVKPLDVFFKRVTSAVPA